MHASRMRRRDMISYIYAILRKPIVADPWKLFFGGERGLRLFKPYRENIEYPCLVIHNGHQ